MLEGLKVRIPDGAIVEGGKPAAETNMDPGYQTQPDAHLTVVDQATGWEYDLWQVHRSPIRQADGAELRFSWGGRTRIDGDGRSEGHATAAHFGNLAGRIRAEELAAKKIEHALAVVVPCDNHTFVYPASGNGRSCANPADAPPMGGLLHLNLPPGSIESLRNAGVPEWKLTILQALATYGGYINDTGSESAWFQFEQEAGRQYLLFNETDSWQEFASKNPGWFHKNKDEEPTYPADHWVGIMRKDADGVDWRAAVWSHLRFVNPEYPNQAPIPFQANDQTPPLVGMNIHGGPSIQEVTDNKRKSDNGHSDAFVHKHATDSHARQDGWDAAPPSPRTSSLTELFIGCFATSRDMRRVPLR